MAQGQRAEYVLLDVATEELAPLLAMRDSLDRLIEKRQRLNGALETAATQARRDARQARGR